MKKSGVKYIIGDQISPCNLSKDKVEAYAESVAELAGFPNDCDLEQLVNRFGGRIEYRDLESLTGENGSVYVHGKREFEILLPNYTGPYRDRFTIAHELGHYFLHSEQGRIPIVAFRKGSTRIEWEANWFAAALLMPKTRFAEVYVETQDIFEIASRFQVSTEAATVRQHALGYTPREVAKSF
jgi:Zn-dependent peptidase ImmA (M78 family)